MTTPQDKTLPAFGAILIYGLVIGGLDNYVRLIAEDSSLWQFHAARGAVTMPLLVLLTFVFGMRLRPVGIRGHTHRVERHLCDTQPRVKY